MLKKYSRLVFACMLCALMLFSSFAYADGETLKKVDSIIGGEQEFLVLATINGNEGKYYEAQVYQLVGNYGDLTHEEIMEKYFADSIYISGIDLYMYYEAENLKPSTGDNVLISINRVTGDTYTLKNGIFKVDYADRDRFKFEAPERLHSLPEHLELIKLHVYTHTNGRINEISIKNDKVSYKEAGEEIIIGTADNVGVKFLDAFGDPTNVEPEFYPELQNGRNGDNSAQKSKWKLVAVILAAGLISGALFVKFAKKFDKRFE